MDTNFTAPRHITIKQMQIIGTKVYEDLYKRTYALNTSHESLDTLNAIMHGDNTQGYKKKTNTPSMINDVLIANTLPNILTINPQPGKLINMPNGWRTARYRFLLEVAISVNGQEMSYYYQGFSDYQSHTMTGIIDPNIRFYINSVTVVRSVKHPTTGQLMQSAVNVYQVMRSESGLNIMELDNMDNFLIRPVDVMSSIFLTEKYQTNQIENTTNQLRHDRVLESERNNNNPYGYFSRIVNSVVTSLNGLDNIGLESQIGYNTGQIYEAAVSTLNSYKGNVFNNLFLLMLAKVTGREMACDFSLNELTLIDPDIASKVIIHLEDSNHIPDPAFNFVSTEYTCPTLQPTDESMLAIFIANTLPSLMTQYLITKANIVLSNLEGEETVFCIGNTIVQDLNLIDLNNRLEAKIRGVLLPTVFGQGFRHVQVNIDCDVLGDINILVVKQGKEPVPFRFPAFADGLYSPIVTDRLHSQAIVSDMYRTLEDVTGISKLDSMHNPTMPIRVNDDFDLDM